MDDLSLSTLLELFDANLDRSEETYYIGQFLDQNSALLTDSYNTKSGLKIGKGLKIKVNKGDLCGNYLFVSRCFVNQAMVAVDAIAYSG